MRKLVIAAIIVALIVVIAVLFLRPSADKGAPVQEEQKTALPGGRSLGMQVTLTRQLFNPSTIKLRQGDSLTLTVLSADADHSVSIPELGLWQTIPNQETGELSFTLDKEISVQCTENCDPGVVFTVKLE